MKSLDEAPPRRPRRKAKPSSAFATGIRKEWREPLLPAQVAKLASSIPQRATRSEDEIGNELADALARRLQETARKYHEDRPIFMATKGGLVACSETEARLIAEYVESSQYAPLETIDGLGARARSINTDSRAFVVENLKPYRCIYTRSVCIVDVDLKDPLGANVAAQRSELLALVHRFVAINPEYGFRCYATAGGFRYIVTSRLLEANTQEPYDMMLQLRADIRYIAMCGLQEMFAARIDPKPERCFEKPEIYAVAKFLWHEGNTAIHHDALQIVKLHDRETAAHEERPLA